MPSSNCSNDSFHTAPSSHPPPPADVPLVSVPQDASRLTVPDVSGSPVLPARSLPSDDQPPVWALDLLVEVPLEMYGDRTDETTEPKQWVFLRVKPDDKEGLDAVWEYLTRRYVGDPLGLDTVARWVHKDEEELDFIAALRELELGDSPVNSPVEKKAFAQLTGGEKQSGGDPSITNESAEKKEVGDDEFIDRQRALEDGRLEPAGE